MSIVVYPIQAVAGAPLYSARDARQAASVYLSGATAARPFGSGSFVRRGTSTATCSATSTTWTTRPHAGVLDVQAAAEAGPYNYAVNTDQTGPMTAAHATLARIDLLWMRLDDPAESDGTTVPAVVAGYTAGVAASTPAPPATPARCMVLAWVNVPASGGGSPTVTWKAPYALAAGAREPAVTASGTGNVGGIVLSTVTLLAAPSVDGDGIKKFRISFSCQAVGSTVAGDVFALAVLRNGVTSVGEVRTTPAGAQIQDGQSFSFFDVPPVGAAVYTIGAIRTAGTGTGMVYAAPATPMQVIVEQIA